VLTVVLGPSHMYLKPAP